MKLAKDEVLVKSWDFAKSKQGSEKKNHILEITNKRLVLSEEGNRGIERTEVGISSISKVHGKTFVPSKFGAIMRIILAIVLVIVGAVLPGLLGEKTAAMLKELSLDLIILAVAFIIAVILFIKAILLLMRGAFELTIWTAGYQTEGFNIGVQRLGKFKASTAKVKMSVHKDVANEILDELGALIVESNN